MARSSIERRQEAERARIEAYEASLRRVTLRARPAPDFQRAIDEAKCGFERDALRDGGDWQPRLKTRDAGRLRLAAARYLFARYPVADHLEQIWIDCGGLEPKEIAFRKRWYIVAAGGGSLYKAGASQWLSRKEVHAFLNPLGRPSFEAALVQAIARSFTDDPKVALRVGQSSISRSLRNQLEFWREVVRFFCLYPTTAEEMEDLRDHLADCFQRDRGFSLKGRTLGSLRRQMEEWHRDIEMIACIEAERRRAEAARARALGQREPVARGGSWAGAAIADWSWSPTVKDTCKHEQFVVVQLRTAADLVEETRAMHHCVATYAAKCIAGHAAIWSLRHRVGNQTSRVLTIEVDSQRRAVQVRGLANRLAKPDERKVLERWGKARGITVL